MILKIRLHGRAGDLATRANSFRPAGGAACVMIPSCKISRPVGDDRTLFLLYIETEVLGSVVNEKTARGEANSTTVRSRVPRRITTRESLSHPSKSQSFVND